MRRFVKVMIETGLFVVLVFSTFFNNAIQWYTHLESYPLQAFVGRNEYANYGKEYERRLVFALYIPYFVMLLSNLALIFAPPSVIERLPFIVTFALNLSIMIVSFALAVPIHKRHAQEGGVTPSGVQELLRVNLLRLGANTLSSAIVLFLLVDMLA
jgi:hypothetical protein